MKSLRRLPSWLSGSWISALVLPMLVAVPLALAQPAVAANPSPGRSGWVSFTVGTRYVFAPDGRRVPSVYSVSIYNSSEETIKQVQPYVNFLKGVGDQWIKLPGCTAVDLAPRSRYECDSTVYGVDQQDPNTVLVIAIHGIADVKNPQTGEITPDAEVTLGVQEYMDPGDTEFIPQRLDQLGDEVYEGDVLRWKLHDLTKQQHSFPYTIHPYFSNLDGVMQGETPTCFLAVPDPHQPPTTVCEGTHTVTAEDVARGYVEPRVGFDIEVTYDHDRNITYPGFLQIGQRVPIRTGTRPGTNPPGTNPPGTNPPGTNPPGSNPPSGNTPPPQPSVPTPTPTPAVRLKTQRIAGASRVETAIALAKGDFKAGAETVIIARADGFADSVAAIPLAKALNAPVLLTPTDHVHPELTTAIRELKPTTVYLLGGPAALSEAVETGLKLEAKDVVRIAGANRAETASEIAKTLVARKAVKRVYITDGTDWQAALVTGPAAAANEGVVLLTNGATQAPETKAFLDTNPPLPTTVIGDTAKTAQPNTPVITGDDASKLSVAVASALFAKTETVGLATTADFADALTGGAHIGRKAGPLVLLPTPTPDHVRTWVRETSSLTQAYIYGGPTRITNEQVEALSS